jgi:hypothetical protein
MSACHVRNHGTAHVMVRSCSCATCTHPQTHEHTHTHTHTSTPGLELPVFAFLLRKTEGPVPSQPSLQVLLKEREKVGKWCHANDEREGLMDLGASAHHVLRRGSEGWPFFFVSHFRNTFLPCLPQRDFGASHLLPCPLFPWPLRRLLALLCCCSALGRRPAPSPRRCFAAPRVRLRGPSPRPIPGVGNLPRQT